LLTVEVVEVLDDAAVEAVDELLVDAVDDVLSGIAGVGGASKRMNSAKLMVSGLLFDTVLALLIVSTVLTRVLREGVGKALRRGALVPLVGKHVVGDALFHVVGLAGEHHHGGVL
jgi:hypothetical protein